MCERDAHRGMFLPEIFDSPAPTPVDAVGITRQFETAYRQRESSEARTIFNQNTLIIWYAFRVEILAKMLDDIIGANPKVQDSALGFQVFLASALEQRFFESAVFSTMKETTDPAAIMMRFGYLLDLRMRGYPVEALSLFDVLRGDFAIIHPFTDRRNSWPQFLALQQGITAMLAGQFPRALQHFSECLARSVTPGLEILHRNALTRSALIESAFGDAHTAKMLIARAEKIPRSDSWAEGTIDASADLVAVLLQSDVQEATRLFKSLDLAEIGEMWPFYILADYQIHDRTGAHARIGKRLENLGALPFPRVTGEGFSGSILALTQGCHCLYAGSTQEAKEFMGAADPNLVVTKLAVALYETWAGDAHVAIQLTNEVRGETVELRRAELWRISVSAEAHLLLGDEEGAMSVLQEIANFPDHMRSREVNFFTADMTGLAAKRLEWWPDQPLDTDAFFDRLPSREKSLTERELEALKLLAKGLTRPAIAAELFITLNTLKSRLRSIYRKLDATSKTDAILKASQRGLL